MTSIPGRTLPDLLARFDELLRQLQAIDYRIPDDAAEVARSALFAPRLIALLDRADELLGVVQQRYEAAAEAGSAAVDDAETLSDIGRLISVEIAAQEILDLLSVGQAELRHRRQDLLQAIDREDFPAVAAACDSGLRALRRTMISVESTLYEYEEKTPPLRLWADLDVSLRTRRLYTRLRRDLAAVEPRREEGLRGSLERARQALAAVRDDEVYPLLRHEDRAAMRQLRDHIDAWAAAGGAQEGWRLWQDLSGFAALLEGVSLRQELQEHDHRLLRRAEATLTATPPPSSRDMADLVAPAFGLDPGLDRLVEDPDTATLGDWSHALETVIRRRRSPWPKDLDDTWPG